MANFIYFTLKNINNYENICQQMNKQIPARKQMKKQMEILQLKSVVPEGKTQWIEGTEDRTVAITPSEEHRSYEPGKNRTKPWGPLGYN